MNYLQLPQNYPGMFPCLHSRHSGQIPQQLAVLETRVVSHELI